MQGNGIGGDDAAAGASASDWRRETLLRCRHKGESGTRSAAGRMCVCVAAAARLLLRAMMTTMMIDDDDTQLRADDESSAHVAARGFFLHRGSS